MAKLLGTYDSLPMAQAALAQLRAGGIDPQCLSVLSGAAPSGTAWKKPLLLGGAAAVAAVFLLPGGGHLLIAGHLARTAAVHTVAVTAKAAATGAAAGGIVDWLRRAGLKHFALQVAQEALAAERCALVLQGSSPGLKPQTADSWAAGLEITPARGFRIGGEFYSINVKNALGTLNPSVTSTYTTNPDLYT